MFLPGDASWKVRAKLRWLSRGFASTYILQNTEGYDLPGRDLHKLIDCGQLFEQELYVWSKLKHPNVLSLLGYAFCNEGCPLFISPWVRYGTAHSFLSEHPEMSLQDVMNIVGFLSELVCARLST